MHFSYNNIQKESSFFPISAPLGRSYLAIRKKVKKIAVYKSSGALGDFAQSIVLFRNLKKMFPDASIDYLGSYQRAHCETIFQNFPFIDDFVEYFQPGKGWSRKQYFLFWKRYFKKWDLIIDTQGKFAPSFYIWMLNPKYFLSVNPLFSSWFFIQNVKRKIHVVSKMNLSLKALGFKDFDFNPSVDIRIEYLVPAQDYLKNFSGPFIALIPGAGHPFKRWPKEMFAQLADILKQKGFSPVLIGAEPERTLLEEVSSLMRSKPIIPLIDDERFGQDPIYSIGLFKQALVTVGNDCGGLHLSALSGCPVVGIYGPTSAVKSGPLGNKNIILYKNMKCSPCKWFRQQCDLDRQCLRSITVTEVVDAVDSILEQIKDKK